MSTRPFTRLLIANRGEIAVRIIRACREMNIETVALYSQADEHAMHVRLADLAVPIGGAAARESYLNIPNLLAAAEQSQAQAVHPGYGFLAENADFARTVTDAGLVFVGPSSDAIRAMGDKAEARARMVARGVPVVPGFQDSQDLTALRAAAEQIGYPVLIKAAAGGGGKAMRIVRTRAEFDEALGAAQREAVAAFGDGRLLLEKYIENARHIEFQVLADAHGKTVHLFERECSIQRRHQKIIEETPSPLLDDALRAEMGAAAVAAAQAVAYTNAGTVEFIVDPATRAFYFLEMNTRLQVEHPITEETTGLDLVQWQIRIAQGERLPFGQSDLQQRGHAVECRIYAEDPANGFLPTAGPILEFRVPSAPGVRADAGIERGDRVTTFYDPLLLKLIARAETRAGAIARMRAALHETVLLGVENNLEFLDAVLAHPTFAAGQATTGFIAQAFSGWRGEDVGWQLDFALAAAALSQSQEPASASPNGRAESDPYSPWASHNPFRTGARPA